MKNYINLFIGILIALSICLSEYFFGFWVSNAAIVGFSSAYFLYKSSDGNSDNDWKLIIGLISAFIIMMILLSRDKDVNELINVILNSKEMK